MFARAFVVVMIVAGASGTAGAQTSGAGAAAQIGHGTLADLVAELERRHPELLAAQRDVAMREARIAPAGALPDPTLSVGSMTGFTRPPFFPASGTPDGAWQVAAAQELPYPGKRALRTEVATLDVETERWRYEGVRRRLAAELKEAYLGYTLAVRTLGVLEEQRTLLTGLHDVADATFRVGRGSQQDVLRVQLEISGLIERATQVEEARDRAVSRINALLVRPQTAAVPVALAFGGPDGPPPAAVLVQEALDHDARIRRETEIIARNERAVDLARRERLPDFGIGVTSQKKVAGMPWMYGVDFMVKVPLYRRRKQDAMVVEATAAVEASRQMRDAARLDVEQRVNELHVIARTSDRLRTLLSGQRAAAVAPCAAGVDCRVSGGHHRFSVRPEQLHRGARGRDWRRTAGYAVSRRARAAGTARRPAARAVTRS